MTTDREGESLLEFTYYRGRVALAALLEALGIGVGDEVAIQAYTCLAVPEGVMAVGAKPLFIDLEVAGYNMSPEDLGKKISGKTKAIVVQHTFGLVADMVGIREIAASAKIPILEDCCHTVRSTRDGRLVGQWGVGSFYSFEWGKPVVAGLGGAACTQSDDLKQKLYNGHIRLVNPPPLKVLKINAQYLAHRLLYRPSLFWKARFLYKLLGKLGAAEGNYNPINDTNCSPDFCWKMPAVLQRRGKRQIQNLNAIENHACEVANFYRSEITNKSIIHPMIPHGCKIVFGRYPIRVSNKTEILRKAREANVELADWYSSPVHPLAPNDFSLVGYRLGSCKEAEMRCSEVVTLPTHQKTRTPDIRRAVRFLNSV